MSFVISVPPEETNNVCQIKSKLLQLANRLTSPIAAFRPTATVTLMPAIVSNRFTAGSSIAAWAMSRSRPAQILAEPIELAQMALDCFLLILGQGLVA